MTTRSHLDEMIRDCASDGAAPIHLVGRAADELARLRAVNAELVAALENIVERGTDSPQHRAAEAAIAKAKQA